MHVSFDSRLMMALRPLNLYPGDDGCWHGPLGFFQWRPDFSLFFLFLISRLIYFMCGYYGVSFLALTSLVHWFMALVSCSSFRDSSRLRRRCQIECEFPRLNLAGILAGILPGILAGILPGILAGILAEILLGIFID